MDELARFADRLQERYEDFEGTAWPESSVPGVSSILVADGFWTSSAPISPQPHWSETVREALAASLSVPVHGLSYDRPAYSYGPLHTLVDLLTTVHRKFENYSSLALPYTGLGFSLGSHVLTRGAAEYPVSATLDRSQPCTLVQLQTPLQLGPDYQRQSISLTRPAASLAFQLQHSYPQIQDAFLEATSMLARAGWRIGFIFWPGDQFTIFPDELIDRVGQAGARVIRVEATDILGNDPFVRHGHVSRSVTVIDAVRDFLLDA